MTHEEAAFLGVAMVRRALVEAIERAGGPLAFVTRGGTRQRPTWRSAGAPNWELVLEVRSDNGVAQVSIKLVEPAIDQMGDEFVFRSWSPSIPWAIAREIGRASDATRHLRIFWGRPYWALEAEHNKMYLAESAQLDLYLKLALPELLSQVNRKLARWGRRPRPPRRATTTERPT